MKLSRRLTTAIVCSLALSGNAMAGVVAEVEENDYNTPQLVAPDTTGTIHIDAVLDDRPGGDLDFYAIDLEKGDVINVDVDCGHNCGDKSVNTFISVLNPDGTVWVSNDDPTGDADEGSVAIDSTTTETADARLDNLTVPATGRYLVGVSNTLRIITDYGNVTSGLFTLVENGDYELIISGVGSGNTPAPTEPAPTDPSTEDTSSEDAGEMGGGTTEEAAGPIPVDIRINPGKRGYTRFQPTHRGKVKVAFLSGEGFDPANVDQSSLRFGATGTEDTLVRCKKRNRDMNGDGIKDLVCFFSNRNAGFDQESTSARLTGTLTDGTEIAGESTLKVVGKRRHHHEHRGKDNGFGHSRR